VKTLPVDMLDVVVREMVLLLNILEHCLLMIFSDDLLFEVCGNFSSSMYTALFSEGSTAVSGFE